MSFWVAFLSVLAIIGIVVAGGFIVALLGKMVLSLFGGGQQQDIKDYKPLQDEYQMSHDHQVEKTVERSASQDYDYALDVDAGLAKEEEEKLNAELNKSKPAVEDDFFKDFSGDDDARFNDEEDLLSMIDQISNDVLDEEEQNANAEQIKESEQTKSVLDKYDIDTYLDEEPMDEENLDEFDDFEDEDLHQKEVVDEATMEEINKLKQEVKEIVEAMEENNNKNETFNEQLINILNELKEANKKNSGTIRTEQEAEQEIESLKQQLEDSRAEMERQLQEKLADKDAEMQAILQEQINSSNAEIELLKAQLSDLLSKMGEDEGEEVEPVDEIEELRNEVKDMLNTMREETEAQNSEFNAQLIAILNEIKEANINKSEEVKVESAEEAVEEIDEWQQQLEEAKAEIEEKYKEEMLHKDAEAQAELQKQMEDANNEINELKEKLNSIMNVFKQESEQAKNENQALIDKLEEERQIRLQLEKDKLDAEKKEEEQLAQLEALRKENEELADKIHNKEYTTFEPLTDEEKDDLYSEVTDIDYNAIKQIYDEELDSKVKKELEGSKAEIESLKEQVSRLSSYIEEREDKLANQINVHEVRNPDFDIEKVSEITAEDVESRIKEKLDESLAEVEALKDEVEATKQEIEKQYKNQLANKDDAVEYDLMDRLQSSAEEADNIKRQLAELDEKLNEQKENVQDASEQCVEEIASAREEKQDEVKSQLEEIGESDADVAVVGPKSNKVALIAGDEVESEQVENIDYETVKKLTDAEIDEIVEKRLEESNKEIENLKEQIRALKEQLENKDDDDDKGATVPVVRSPLFDVEAIKNITAQEVEAKVKERLDEAMKEVDEMKKQLENSKKEVERQYKEQLTSKSEELEYEMRARLKASAAEVVALKEQLADLTEQLELEREQSKNASVSLVEQLEEDRKQKEEIAKLHFAELDAIAQDSNPEMALVETNREVTVIGPKNNQIALITGTPALVEGIETYDDEIPTIDIETVKKLTEEEIEEKVQQRMSGSIIEIEELKKQILNLTIQIQEVKASPVQEPVKPTFFHYSTEDAYMERIAILEERLKVAKKDLKINNKELNPLEKVNRTLERDKAKLHRKEAIAAKKQVALYGVNNYVDIDKEKAEKLAQELELLSGLRLSVSHCEEVMNANIDRYPILVHTDKILKENIANIESDLATLNRELEALREKNGSNNE